MSNTTDHSNPMRTPTPDPAFCLDLTEIRPCDRFADLVVFNDELTRWAKSLPAAVLPAMAQSIVSRLGEGFASRPDLKVLRFRYPDSFVGGTGVQHLEAIRFHDGGKRLIVLRPDVKPEAGSYAGVDFSKAAAARGIKEAVIVGPDLFKAIARWAGGNLIETFTRLMDELAKSRRTAAEAGSLKLQFRLPGDAKGNPRVVACEFKRLADPKGRATFLGGLSPAGYRSSGGANGEVERRLRMETMENQ